MTENQLKLKQELLDLVAQGVMKEYDAKWIISAVDLLNQEPLSRETRQMLKKACNDILARLHP